MTDKLETSDEAGVMSFSTIIRCQSIHCTEPICVSCWLVFTLFMISSVFTPFLLFRNFHGE